MHGLVHRSVRSLVVSAAGEATWGEILTATQMGEADFLSMESYADESTLKLLGGVCARLQLSVDQALLALGRHWITFVEKEGYAAMLHLFGSDLRSCLKSLNQMHARMGTSLRGIHFPRFDVLSEDPKEILLEYQSTRSGMLSFLVGLLEGLSQYYQTRTEIQGLPKAETGETHDRVRIRFVA
jgi:hypothetical protein